MAKHILFLSFILFLSSKGKAQIPTMPVMPVAPIQAIAVDATKVANLFMKTQLQDCIKQAQKKGLVITTSKAEQKGPALVYSFRGGLISGDLIEGFAELEIIETRVNYSIWPAVHNYECNLILD